MLKRSLILSAILSLSVSSLNIIAQIQSQEDSTDLLLAPKCFIANNSFKYDELVYNKSHDMVLFSVNRTAWLQQLEDLNYKSDCGKFVSVHEEWTQYLEVNKLNERYSNLDYSYFLNDFLASTEKNIKTIFDVSMGGRVKEHPELLESFYQEINSDRILHSLDELTAHYNRASYSTTGYQAALNIKTWMEDLALTSNKSQSEFSYELIPTSRWYQQPSVVAVLGKDLPGKALVISAHMDTTGGGRRPGADDDGCGAVTVLETARLLVNSQHQFNRPIYFIWYAAEEEGLVGSKKVVKQVIERKIEIDSVLHLDVIGRRVQADDPTMWFLKDYVNLEFTEYLSELAKNQVKVPVDYAVCGYACSDHASWNSAGFVAGAGVESSFDNLNPYIHTPQDTKDNIYVENMVNFTKLALAYAVDRAA